MPRTPAGTAIAAKPTPQATPAQLNYLIGLIQERDTTGIELPRVEPGFVTMTTASSLITKLKAAPRKAKGTQPTEEHLGLWTYDGGAFEVRQSESSGRFYTVGMTDDGWRMATGMTVKVIDGGHRMTDEEIRAFGVTFVHCMICGRRLTNPESIEAGIGPICATL
jgi:hypothetical protein